MHTQKSNRRPYPSDLTIRQFALLVLQLATRRKRTGRPRADMKEVIDGILTVGRPTKRKDYKGVAVISCAGTHIQLELEMIPKIILKGL